MLVPAELLLAEIKQRRDVPFLLELSVDLRISQLIEVLVRESFTSIETFLWRVNHDLTDEADEHIISFGKYLS